MKQDLMPYIYKQAAQSVNQGIPLMRPMYMEFPDDSNCSGLDRQYMLGSQILVAPIMEESGVVDYYLPEGEWHHLIDGRDIHVESQGQWLSETYDFLSLPVWQKIQ